MVSSADGSDKAFEQLSKDFEAKYPKVHVKFSTVPNANFAAARSSRLTANKIDVTLLTTTNVPAYVTGAAKSDDDLAADAGLFVDLSSQPFLNNFTPTVIDALKYNGKSYAVPTGLSYYTGVYYNKALFQQLGLAVPTTWTEFQSIVTKLKAAGHAALGIGGKDSWPAGLDMIGVVQSLYPSADDKTQLAEQLWQHKASLSEGKQLQVLSRVQDLYTDTQKNFAGIPYATMPAEFANGTVAMMVDGTWNQTTIDQAVNGKFAYGYFPLPASDNAADNSLLGGKVELRLAVASKAPNRAAALAYLQFFSQPDEYRKFIQTTGFAPAQPNIPASAFLQSIAPYTTTFSPAWDTVWTPNSKAGPSAAFPFNYSAIAPLGTKDAAGAAKAAQVDWAAAK